MKKDKLECNSDLKNKNRKEIPHDKLAMGSLKGKTGIYMEKYRMVVFTKHPENDASIKERYNNHYSLKVTQDDTKGDNQ